MAIRTEVKPGGSGLTTGGARRTKLIIGLGNIGDDYADTRHNIGFTSLDFFKDKHELANFKNRSQVLADVSEGSFGPHKLILAKPTTLMNLSGKAAFALMEYYKVTSQDVLVVHDELDVPFGSLRGRFGGGHAGHNGVLSVANAIGQDFYRLRLGIGSEHPQRVNDTSTFVLTAFTKAEQKKLPALMEATSKLIEDFINEQIQDTTWTVEE